MFIVLQPSIGGIVAEQVGVPTYEDREERSVKIALAGIAEAKNKIAMGSSCRRTASTKLDEQVSNIHKAVTPDETLFVVDAMTGKMR